MQIVNEVKLVGTLHFVKGEQVLETREGKYLRFSIKQDSLDCKGNPRHDFILVRAFDPTVWDVVQKHQEGTSIGVEGTIRSSVGSGEIYVRADRLIS